MSLRRSTMRGFTLIEMVVSIVLTAIVVGFATMFLTTPVDAYMSQTRRAAFTESSEAMTRRMSADLRKALPNSIRIGVSGTRVSVEMLLVEDVAFFRTSGSADLALATGNDAAFSSIGKFRPRVARPLDLTRIQGGVAVPLRLAIGNKGTPANSSAYSSANVMTSTATTLRLLDDSAGIDNEDKIQVLGTSVKFSAPLSASNRMYLVSGPVTYICNSATQTLRRFSNYAVGAGTPVTEADARFAGAGVENVVIGSNVTACRFTCANGAAVPCKDTFIADMAVAQPAKGQDFMRVFLEEHVDNTQ